MKKKIIFIENCNECPHFSNDYPTWNSYCNKLGRRLASEPGNILFVPIPDDCPLSDDPEE